jgi:cytochrome c-type biogenesis protein CcmH/NrfG
MLDQNKSAIFQSQKSLSDQLDQIENSLGKVGLGMGHDVFDILHQMDEAYFRMQDLSRKGITFKGEEGQFENIGRNLKKDAGIFLREAGGIRVLNAERVKVKPEQERWWWYLDQLQTEKRKGSLKRFGISLGIAVCVFVVLGLIYRFFLAPDPKVIAAIEASQNAQADASNGDLDKALIEVNNGLEVVPDSSDLWVMKGIILESLGRTDESQQAFAKAQQLINDQETFLLTKAQDYLIIGQNDQTIAAAQAALAINSESSKAYLILGSAYENNKDFTNAMAAYEKASTVGDASNDPTTVAQARIKLAYLMQAMPILNQATTPASTPTP